MKKLNLPLIGLLQAAGVLIYCGLVAGLINLLSGFSLAPAPLIGPAVMLILLVVSAAITGSLVFGHSIYLALKDKIKEAIYLLLFTILFLIGIVFIGIIITVSITLA